MKASMLGTAQCISSTSYGKIQFFIISSNETKQKFIETLQTKIPQNRHKTQHSWLPFKTKNKPTIIILNSKLHIEDNYTKLKKTSQTIHKI